MCFFFSGYGDHRDLHVLTHSFPTRRSSDLDAHAARIEGGVGAAVDDDAVVPGQLDEVAVAPDARIGLEVGGAVALVVRVVPEADRHAGKGLHADQLALLAGHRPAPVVVDRYRHAEAAALDERKRVVEGK